MEKIIIEVEDYGKVSDGYHTIAELYDHRIRLYLSLAKLRAKMEHETDMPSVCWCKPRVEVVINGTITVHDYPYRSKLHADGSAFDGWFILGLTREPGKQITYHLPISYWDEAEFAETLDKAPEWDGHTSADVLERLKNI